MVKTMAKIKIGIIGVGNISECHISGYKNSPDAELYAFCDINEERLKEKGARHGVSRLYTSAEEMCNALPELDAVSVCVWNCNHYECTMAALRAGKHVLCEKPLAMNEQQAIEMRDFAKAQGKLLMVGFVRRFMAETEELKRLTDEGYFGDMYYTKATYLRLNGNPGGWFSDKKRSGGGPVIDLGVHVIDEARYLMGNPQPVSVYATVQKRLDRTPHCGGIEYLASDAGAINDVEDFAQATIRFDNGGVMMLETSYALNSPDPICRIELYGTKAGCITDPLRILEDNGKELKTIDKYKELPANTFDGMFEKEIAHFVDCVATGCECRNPADDGVVVMRILDAIYESGRTGHEVVLK
ncbi:MAG: Gfo/Idh/MocA family oxidoreductase [Ruminococcaceae bacterium]|nr:Gfo/Idh/MocA family oxidoreductase [Oscillospiraceae bacterium]